tara:strand:+ start:443 stop:901 length:459 start_codon:yes stop_codon:yes gene_type:complete
MLIDDPNSTRTLLSAANHFILNTKEDMIQNKIRQLLVGTELEEIAKQAQIVIHIQDDAKDFLREKIVEQRARIESKKLLQEDFLEATTGLDPKSKVLLSRLSPQLNREASSPSRSSNMGSVAFISPTSQQTNQKYLSTKRINSSKSRTNQEA